jgi:hypothetical protein
MKRNVASEIVVGMQAAVHVYILYIYDIRIYTPYVLKFADFGRIYTVELTAYVYVKMPYIYAKSV